MVHFLFQFYKGILFTCIHENIFWFMHKYYKFFMFIHFFIISKEYYAFYNFRVQEFFSSIALFHFLLILEVRDGKLVTFLCPLYHGTTPGICYILKLI